MIGHSHDPQGCNEFVNRLQLAEEAEKICEKYRTNILGDLINDSSAYFYPFIIEFALIGASVSFIMSNHIGKR